MFRNTFFVLLRFYQIIKFDNIFFNGRNTFFQRKAVTELLIHIPNVTGTSLDLPRPISISNGSRSGPCIVNFHLNKVSKHAVVSGPILPRKNKIKVKHLPRNEILFLRKYAQSRCTASKQDLRLICFSMAHVRLSRVAQSLPPTLESRPEEDFWSRSDKAPEAEV